MKVVAKVFIFDTVSDETRHETYRYNSEEYSSQKEFIQDVKKHIVMHTDEIMLGCFLFNTAEELTNPRKVF